ncbi:MAG: DUF1007 family protein [Proteobacteria bacterium]|nr:DUF1007 family protein [Pseudomonadota bacterium]
MNRFVLALILAALALLPAGRVFAHPHAWITVKVEVRFDQAGAITGLREIWLFDEAYTAFAVEGLGRAGKGPSAAQLAELLAVNMTNLEEYDFFTRVKSNGAPVKIGKATDASSRLRGSRLEMSFSVTFVEPVPVDAGAFSYAIFDPTYYIEMLHAEAGDAITLIGAPAGCKPRIDNPAPNPDTVSLAYALDATQSAGDTLGEAFAEWVTIQCG